MLPTPVPGVVQVQGCWWARQAVSPRTQDQEILSIQATRYDLAFLTSKDDLLSTSTRTH